MKAKELGHVIIKLVGIFCLARALVMLSWYLGYFVHMSGLWFSSFKEFLSSFLSFMVPMMVLLYLARLFLKNTERAGRIIGIDALDDSEEIIRVEEAQVVAFSILGLILVILAIPKLAGFGTYSLYYRYLEQNSPELIDRMVMVGSAESLALMISLPVQILLGLYLFFRPRKFVNLWQRSQKKQNQKAENLEYKEQ